MKMKRCVIPSILLMLALEAAVLVAGHPSAMAVTNDEGTILLPSEGKDQVGTAAASRPWDCCDNTICTRSLPPICICLDEVDECASTCMACVPSVSNPFRRVCGDQYFGDPGPKCNDDVLKAQGDHQVSVAAVAAEKNGAEEEKPWECCDMPLCTRSYPPMCRCVDEVEQCAATCNSCGVSILNPFRRVCNDWYNGFPGRRCTEAAGSGGNN
ncbi:Bowman-Birk type trypsin inhibitor-like [Triticum dicoccoides]|uniref:Bowman-Birk type trypsin inhibitor-like n=1 Tax=Triticum dicoccoides TaxID=85692 RepID=UPI00016F23B0|nr:Bowman-Birk type trypsin inhibitor-like [Triticum dicoccoides]BDI54646.1 Bowman-Birk type trypsin inhibitor [Triticum aestivum]